MVNARLILRGATIALTNSDVVGIGKAGISPDIIIAKIKNTPCSFDTSPAALKEGLGPGG